MAVTICWQIDLHIGSPDSSLHLFVRVEMIMASKFCLRLKKSWLAEGHFANCIWHFRAQRHNEERATTYLFLELHLLSVNYRCDCYWNILKRASDKESISDFLSTFFVLFFFVSLSSASLGSFLCFFICCCGAYAHLFVCSARLRETPCFENWTKIAADQSLLCGRYLNFVSPQNIIGFLRH